MYRPSEEYSLLDYAVILKDEMDLNYGVDELLKCLEVCEEAGLFKNEQDFHTKSEKMFKNFGKVVSFEDGSFVITCDFIDNYY